MTNADHASYVRTNLRFRDANQHAGQFQGLRFYRADGGWFIDGERSDGTVGDQYEFHRPDQALNAMPILFAILVLGVKVVQVPGPYREDAAQTPAEWRVDIPIVNGGVESSQWKGRLAAENFIRSWMRSV